MIYKKLETPRSIREFKPTHICNKCGLAAIIKVTGDADINKVMCTAPMLCRTSGICGGLFVKIEDEK